MRAGFSLIQLSIVLAIVAVGMAAALPGGKEGSQIAKSDDTVAKMQRIEQALAGWRTANGRYPCPSSVVLQDSDSKYGAEQGAPGLCDNGNYGLAGEVVAGTVPTKALGLPSSDMLDGWGRRFTYMVDRRATTSSLGPIVTPDQTVSVSCEAATRSYTINALSAHGLSVGQFVTIKGGSGYNVAPLSTAYERDACQLLSGVRQVSAVTSSTAFKVVTPCRGEYGFPSPDNATDWSASRTNLLVKRGGLGRMISDYSCATDTHYFEQVTDGGVQMILRNIAGAYWKAHTLTPGMSVHIESTTYTGSFPSVKGDKIVTNINQPWRLMTGFPLSGFGFTERTPVPSYNAQVEDHDLMLMENVDANPAFNGQIIFPIDTISIECKDAVKKITTVRPHGLANNDYVTITGVPANMSECPYNGATVNGIFRVSIIDAMTFQFNTSDPNSIGTATVYPRNGIDGFKYLPGGGYGAGGDVGAGGAGGSCAAAVTADGGAIAVLRPDGSTPRAVMALISHGQNGHGAYSANGSNRIDAKSALPDERDNAGVDEKFDPAFDNQIALKNAPNDYDDIVRVTQSCP